MALLLSATGWTESVASAPRQLRSPGMKRLRAFLDRFTLGNRPPTGPLTTQEVSDAEALRQTTLTEEEEQKQREREDLGESH